MSRELNAQLTEFYLAKARLQDLNIFIQQRLPMTGGKLFLSLFSINTNHTVIPLLRHLKKECVRKPALDFSVLSGLQNCSACCQRRAEVLCCGISANGMSEKLFEPPDK